ncbi:TetR/AcrR family transcriptional regulator [Flavobacterium granuli]|uniref:TetR family transcriptional regulator n=1 Tax=Flavobacterium granuli TaxID=280093 RepID=A0A1M5JWA1_9FLAO|nr:TetR/AcrR family transcriptional regulator [Flavobacterium granuli]PRZ26083.1 TetR family transcriptional regulator [Flavobacterium granuli]SHG44857.1 transcriptional regulator, TetR family [Flavobacterium granuli]
MKEKIVSKASELFLKLGFKSITMDDIAGEMCISKKTIYKYFCNKEVLIEECTTMVHQELHRIVDTITAKDHNAIKENFEIKRMFKEMFSSSDTSPLYQLKKYYPAMYHTVISREIDVCQAWFKQNIQKGIEQGLYRQDIDINTYVIFYYTLLFSINENTGSEKDAQNKELQALEYHTRAMATAEGIIELEKNLLNFTR